MFSLAHISDIHLAPLPQPSFYDLLSKRMTGYINWKLNRAHGNHHLESIIKDIKTHHPDHICITGDLVNLALKDEFIAARRWLDTLGSPDHISVIPGNHDAYVRSGLSDACDAWEDYMPATGGFPYVRRIGPLAIIGVSSAEPSLPFLSIGRFRPDQAVRLAQILKQTKDEELFRIILIHHPPFRYPGDIKKRLYGIGLFQNTIQQHGTELILHGHTHRASFQTVGTQSIPVIGVSAASSSSTAPHKKARWNLLHISRSHTLWNCVWMERIIQSDGTFSQSDQYELIKNGKNTHFLTKKT
jgi:3',5'-cyclic AMP phosphodiesterase CpdA